MPSYVSSCFPSEYAHYINRFDDRSGNKIVDETEEIIIDAWLIRKQFEKDCKKGKHTQK